MYLNNEKKKFLINYFIDMLSDANSGARNQFILTYAAFI